MPHEQSPDAVPRHICADPHVAQIVLLRPRRPNDRLGAEAANHYAPRADWTVESQYQERTSDREAQYNATIVRGASSNNPSANLCDTMSLPPELASIV